MISITRIGIRHFSGPSRLNHIQLSLGIKAMGLIGDPEPSF